MPHQAVADDFQAMLLAVVDKLVGHAEVEDALGGRQHLALHAVLGHGTVEMLVEDGIGLRHLTVALPLVDGRADEAVLANGVLQALCLGGEYGYRQQSGCHEMSNHRFYCFSWDARASMALLISSIFSSLSSYLEMIHIARPNRMAGITHTNQRMPSSAMGVWSITSLL